MFCARAQRVREYLTNAQNISQVQNTNTDKLKCRIRVHVYYFHSNKAEKVTFLYCMQKTFISALYVEINDNYFCIVCGKILYSNSQNIFCLRYFRRTTGGYHLRNSFCEFQNDISSSKIEVERIVKYLLGDNFMNFLNFWKFLKNIKKYNCFSINIKYNVTITKLIKKFDKNVVSVNYLK